MRRLNIAQTSSKVTNPLLLFLPRPRAVPDRPQRTKHEARAGLALACSHGAVFTAKIALM